MFAGVLDNVVGPSTKASRMENASGARQVAVWMPWVTRA